MTALLTHTLNTTRFAFRCLLTVLTVSLVEKPHCSCPLRIEQMNRSSRPHSFSSTTIVQNVASRAQCLSFGSYCAPLCAPAFRRAASVQPVKFGIFFSNPSWIEKAFLESAACKRVTRSKRVLQTKLYASGRLGLGLHSPKKEDHFA